jgi:hypothetical protein
MAVLPVHSDHAGGDCRTNENALQPLSEDHNSLKPDWQKHVLACSYVELGMLDDAALALEEITPEDKTRTQVMGARVAIYMAAKKWEMAAAVASHLVKTEPETSGWWINLAYAKRRCEGIESAEAILLQARKLHHNNAMSSLTLHAMPAWHAASKRQRNGSNAPSNWTSSFKSSLSMTRTCGLFGIGLLICRRLARFRSFILQEIMVCPFSRRAWRIVFPSHRLIVGAYGSACAPPC